MANLIQFDLELVIFWFPQNSKNVTDRGRIVIDIFVYNGIFGKVLYFPRKHQNYFRGAQSGIFSGSNFEPDAISFNNCINNVQCYSAILA